LVKISKSPLPDGIKIKSENDYRNDPLLSLIVEDCYGKCYICEDNSTKNINIEHRIPHKGDAKLQYDWNNLFLSCPHCNLTKGSKFIGIIDPTKFDPEEYFVLSINLDSTVSIDKLKDDIFSDETIELLGLVYNGSNTDIKQMESAALREAIIDNLLRFQLCIDGYINEPDLWYGKKIRDDLSRKSQFACFKRHIVRNIPEIANDFVDELN
jgi:hypothetical protein